MIVVSDTTPLISLMKVGHLNILEKLYQEILIPRAVYNELTTSNDYQDEVAAIKASPFIKVVEVNEQRAVEVLQRATGLDLGESEAIICADSSKADVLLMDEIAGRKVAKSFGIRIVGTLGVLLGAFDEGFLSAAEIETAVGVLQETRRWISKELFEYARQYVRR